MKKNFSLMRDEGGAITVMTVIIMGVFVGLLAIVIDLGHLHTVQNELRNAADACALRGARRFVPENLTGLTPMAPEWDVAKAEANLAIGINKSDDKGVMQPLTDLPTTDMQVGVWNCETQDWVGGAPSTTPWPPDISLWGHAVGPAIALSTQKTAGYNAGPVTMTLANIFSISTVPVKTEATAYLSPFGGPLPETPILPFGPMSDAPELKTGGPFEAIFRNDNTDNAGWSNLQGVPQGGDPPNTNTNDLFKLIDSTATPNAGGDHPLVSINNGNIEAALNNPSKGMTATGNRFGLTNDPAVTGSTDPNVYKPDPAYAANEYLLPVFDRTLVNGDPNKFNQAGVVGGVMVRLVEVGTSPYAYVKVEILTGTYVAPGWGGGLFFGVLSNVPKIVR
jgi:hypothetical protein